MCFNFCGVYILRIYNFRGFTFLHLWLLGTVVLKYSLIYRVSSYTIIAYSSCRGSKFAGLAVGFVWRCHRIEWRTASEDFTSTGRFGCLSLEKGLFAPVKEATEKIRSLLQWREAPKQSALYYAWSCASVRSTCLPAARTMAREQGTSQARLPHKQLLPF